MAGKPRVKIPKSVAAGDVVTIKTLIKHKMESGQRKDKEGNTIPRDIINNFEASFNGNVVFSVDMDPAVSANPYIEFASRVSEAGTFVMKWTDDAGAITEISKDIALKS
ncbi:MAG: sulfur-oxidizing protein SoxZ [Granulosicoccus sp.]|jgi:sulfur-oxidizing protein SoxZ